VTGGDHHHGILAGASAGAVAVIVVPLLAIWLARGVITGVLTDLVWLIFAVAVAAAALAVAYAYRWGWHKHRQFTLAAAPPVVRAEVVRDPPPGELASALAAVTAGMEPEAVAVLLHKLAALREDRREPLELERGE